MDIKKLIETIARISEKYPEDKKEIDFDGLVKELKGVFSSDELKDVAKKEKIVQILEKDLNGSYEKIKMSVEDLIELSTTLDWLSETERNELMGCILIGETFIKNYYQNMQSELQSIQNKFTTEFLREIEIFDGSIQLLKNHKKIEVFEHFRELFKLMNMKGNKDLKRMVLSVFKNENDENEKFKKIIEIINLISIPEKFEINEEGKIFYTENGKSNVDVRYFYPTKQGPLPLMAMITMNQLATGEGYQGLTHPYKSYEISQLLEPKGSSYRDLMDEIKRQKMDANLLGKINDIDKEERAITKYIDYEGKLDGIFTMTVMGELVRLQSNKEERASSGNVQDDYQKISELVEQAFIMSRNKLNDKGGVKSDAMELDSSMYLLELYKKVLEKNRGTKKAILKVLEKIKINYILGEFKENKLTSSISGVTINIEKISVLLNQMIENIVLVDSPREIRLLDLLGSSEYKIERVKNTMNVLIVLYPEYEKIILENKDRDDLKDFLSGYNTELIGGMRATQRANEETQRANEATQRANEATQRTNILENLRFIGMFFQNNGKQFWKQVIGEAVQLDTVFDFVRMNVQTIRDAPENEDVHNIKAFTDEVFIKMCISQVLYNEKESPDVEEIIIRWKDSTLFLFKILKEVEKANRDGYMSGEKYKEIIRMLKDNKPSQKMKDKVISLAKAK